MPEITRLHPTVRMHQVVIHNGTIYTAGQVAEANAGDSIEAQTREILERIDALLAEAGSAKNRILTAYVYLADIADFAGMNSVWDAWVAPDGKPVRTTIEARLTDPAFKVEIGVIAAV